MSSEPTRHFFPATPGQTALVVWYEPPPNEYLLLDSRHVIAWTYHQDEGAWPILAGSLAPLAQTLILQPNGRYEDCFDEGSFDDLDAAVEAIKARIAKRGTAA
jgi:hypothetical protein